MSYFSCTRCSEPAQISNRKDEALCGTCMVEIIKERSQEDGKPKEEGSPGDNDQHR